MAEALAWCKKKYKLVLGPLRKAVQRQCQQRSAARWWWYWLVPWKTRVTGESAARATRALEVSMGFLANTGPASASAHSASSGPAQAHFSTSKMPCW